MPSLYIHAARARTLVDWNNILYIVEFCELPRRFQSSVSEVMESDLIYTLFVSACLLLALADGCVGSG